MSDVASGPWGLLAQGIGDTLSLGWSGIQQGIQSKWRKEDIARADSLTRETWAREDNAVQRRAADMKKAGINPLLAAGSAASASQPLYSSSQRQNAPSPFSNPLDALMAKENIATTRAQRELLLAQAQKTSAETDMAKGIYEHNMSVKGNGPYGATPTVWGSLIGIIRDWYYGKYAREGKAGLAIEKLTQDISKTGLGQAETEQVVRNLENAQRAMDADDKYQKSDKTILDYLKMGFEGASPEANHY